ncbi:Pathogenesis-related protein PR-1 type [Bienertia sinuspersici]
MSFPIKFELFSCFIFVTLALAHMCHAQNSPQDYVNAHNAARAEGDCVLQHSTGGPYGKNIAKGSGALIGTNVVKLWVAEKANYNYNFNTCAPNKVCGHYTQLVWRNSICLGCARVQCNNGWFFITCN